MSEQTTEFIEIELELEELELIVAPGVLLSD